VSWQIAAKPHAQRIICDFYRIAGRRRHFFLAELLFTDSAADDGARIGADADVGFAWSGGGDGAGAGRGQPATGSSATIAKFCSTDSGDFPRSPSLSPTRAREALMMAGAGGAMRATGWRATAIRFQQFGEGARSMSSSLSRFSGWRSRSLSLSDGLTDSTGARDGTRADGGLDRGRRRL
jgi:hypothetical protein